MRQEQNYRSVQVGRYARVRALPRLQGRVLRDFGSVVEISVGGRLTMIHKDWSTISKKGGSRQPRVQLTLTQLADLL